MCKSDFTGWTNLRGPCPLATNPIVFSMCKSDFTSLTNLRGPCPLATNPIVFLCVSRILQVRYLPNFKHFYFKKYQVSWIFMSIKLRIYLLLNRI